MTTADRIRDYIIDDIGWPGLRADLTEDYPLIDNEVIDSLALLQMVGFVESEFDIEVLDDELLSKHWGSIGGILRLIESKRAS